MKLISCYVAHFGKISEFKYEFGDGLNSIIEENGWGKTTFSVFIKAMFYGMEYSPNTKKKLLERNHYLPWDGSVCGGNIVFSAGDRVYKIERTFGKTDKEDTFALYDVATGLESSDYTDNIGEELFKVDRDSFEKSVYVPQLSTGTGMTDSLNAKMGNLAAAKDDISNFDKALKIVKDAKTEYTRNSKINPGKLSGVRREINQCKEDLEKLPGILEGYEAGSGLIEQKQNMLANLQQSKASLVEKIQVQSKKEQELGAYKTHKENLMKEIEGAKEYESFFNNGVPSQEEIDLLQQLDRDLAIHERALETLDNEHKDGNRVFSKPFEKRIPDEGEFALWNKMATNLSELRAKAENVKLSEEAKKQLSELKFFFAKKVPSDEELSTIEKKTTQLASLDGMISQANERVITVKAQNDAERKARKETTHIGLLIASVMAIILLATGFLFNNYNDNGLGILVEEVSFLVAIIDIVFIAIYFFISRKRNVKREESYEDSLAAAEQQLQDLYDQKTEIEAECAGFLGNFLLTRAETMLENVYEIRRKLDQYRHLLEEEDANRVASEGTLDELADLQLELYTKIQPFASAYGINLYDMGEEFNFLNQLKRDADKYANYLAELEEMARHENSIRNLSKDVEAIISKYPVTEGLNRNEKIHQISTNVSKYTALRQRIENLEDSIKDFEKTYGVSEDALSVDDLQQKQVEIDEQIVDLNRQLTQDKENMSQYADEIERLGDIQEQIERLENLECEYKEKNELLGLTAEYLQKARENFLSKYMEPLQNGLHKYFSLIDAGDETKSGYNIADFELDLDLNIRLDYQGNTKSSEFLSQGYQDLTALCSRLALVDVLYTEEKPLLILDDPFTNFDDKKIKEALDLIEKIAQNQQVIYFTCHESRV